MDLTYEPKIRSSHERIITTQSVIKKRQFIVKVSLEERLSALNQLFDYLNLASPFVDRKRQILENFESPNTVCTILANCLEIGEVDIHVTGVLEARIAIIFLPKQTLLVKFGSFAFEQIPLEIQSKISKWTHVTNYIMTITHDNGLKNYIAHPKVYLCALYHPEIFPLPRFSLAISDLLRTCRSVGVGNLYVDDMQLGATIETICSQIKLLQPDIIGISATFGQQDVLEALLNKIEPLMVKKATLILGGSLPVLNREVLINQFPNSIISTGAGEPTIAGIIGYRRGELRLRDVPGIYYLDNEGKISKTIAISPRSNNEMIPELDLLQPTLKANGVMQLETSRGCSYFCSFCPRAHKGIWSGDDPASIEILLPDIDRIMSKFPKMSRKLFLVDEEFIGYRRDGESEARVEQIADMFKQAGFQFETNSRVDQVFREKKDKNWHIKRLMLWRKILHSGLHRCLFGVESGVDETLVRFNKKSTSYQNTVAIRILSLIGVPPRYTYITFDPLMSRQNLIDTYNYQGRTDLLLRQLPDLTDSEVYDIAKSDQRSEQYNQEIPFYREISYMLVSIECLMDAPYTAIVREKGLLDQFNTLMGRYECRYLDPEIGLFSKVTQMWIDRNFSLDYLLKSIQKYAKEKERIIVAELRNVIKDYSYNILGTLLLISGENLSSLKICNRILDVITEKKIVDKYSCANFENKYTIILESFDVIFDLLANDVTKFMNEKISFLPDFEKKKLIQEIGIWKNKDTWESINA